MPLLTKITEVAAKHETTVGTAISIGATDGTFRAYNVNIQLDATHESRETQGSLSNAAGVVGERSGTMDFEVDLCGGASAPAWATTLLPACGLKNTAGTFTLDALPPEAAGAGTKTITLGKYVDGILYKLHGAMGNVRFFGTPGKVARAAFSFRGLWNAVADVAIIGPTKETVAKLRSASATLTVGGIAMKVGQWELDLGNEIVLRPDPATVQGFHSAVIVSRNPMLKIDPEAALVATYDPFGDYLALTQRALSLVLGTAGNRLTYAAAKAQVVNVQQGDRTGLHVHQLEYQLCRSAAHEDELSLVID